jgi:hypothetical protein
MKARSQANSNAIGVTTGLSTLEAPRPRHRGSGVARIAGADRVGGGRHPGSVSDTLYVTRISVAGNALTPAQEIVQISGIGGQHMFWVNHAEASRRMANGIPSIKSARVDCQLPNRCTIKVQERQPSVAWRFGGAVTWIADDGMACRAPRTNLPLITIDALGWRCCPARKPISAL